MTTRDMIMRAIYAFREACYWYKVNSVYEYRVAYYRAVERCSTLRLLFPVEFDEIWQEAIKPDYFRHWDQRNAKEYLGLGAYPSLGSDDEG